MRPNALQKRKREMSGWLRMLFVVGVVVYVEGG